MAWFAWVTGSRYNVSCNKPQKSEVQLLSNQVEPAVQYNILFYWPHRVTVKQPLSCWRSPCRRHFCFQLRGLKHSSLSPYTRQLP